MKIEEKFKKNILSVSVLLSITIPKYKNNMSIYSELNKKLDSVEFNFTNFFIQNFFCKTFFWNKN